jgi:hypothetical protein
MAMMPSAQHGYTDGSSDGYAEEGSDGMRNNADALGVTLVHSRASYLLGLLGLAALSVGTDVFLILVITLPIRESLMIVHGLRGL